MPDDKRLDERVNEVQNKEKTENLEEKTETGFLKALTKFSLKDWAKVGAVGLGAAYFSGATLVTGIRAVATTMLSYSFGKYLANKRKITRKGLKDEFYIGAFASPALYATYAVINRISNPILKTAFGLATQFPLITGIILGMEYLTEKGYTPWKLFKGLFTGKTWKLPYEMYKEKFKPKYKNALTENYKWVSLPVVANYNFVPLEWQVPAVAGVRALVRYVTARAPEKKTKEYAKQPAVATT